LLVVVAIIALLISILLPSLRDAREQAKVTKCLANYRQITTSTVQYFLDYNDNFPFWDPNLGGGVVCSWLYGGKTADPWWKDYGDGSGWIPVERRPMNKYLMGGHMPSDLYVNGQLDRRAEIPVLQCPADIASHQRVFWTDPLHESEPVSCYNDVGTSFQYNLHALFDVNWYGDTNPWTKPGDWNEIGRQLVRDVLTKHSATYVMFLEDPMDWSMFSRLIEMGNHGRFGRHCMGFLDGHADYKYADTRSWCGLGWEAIDTEWVVTVDHTPPIHYDLTSGSVNDKNCDPPLTP
jgi:hypothetical protein